MTDSQINGPASSARKRGLGRGLDALFGGPPTAVAAPAADGASLVEVSPTAVDPNPEQPRQHFDEEALAALTESIRLHGLLHPIVIEPKPGGGYQLVAGERRLRASQRAGLPTIPALVRPAAPSSRDALEVALTENLLRADLSPIEEATAYSRLADTFGLSHEAIALRLGRSRPAVSNTIRLLQLPAAVQQALADGALSAGHARCLLALSSEALQQQVAQQILAEGLSVRATERLVQRRLEPAPPAAPSAREQTSPDDDALRRGLEAALGTPVQLQRRRRGGRIVIDFHSDDDLDDFYTRVGGPPL